MEQNNEDQAPSRASSRANLPEEDAQPRATGMPPMRAEMVAADAAVRQKEGVLRVSSGVRPLPEELKELMMQAGTIHDTTNIAVGQELTSAHDTNAPPQLRVVSPEATTTGPVTTTGTGTTIGTSGDDISKNLKIADKVAVGVQNLQPAVDMTTLYRDNQHRRRQQAFPGAYNVAGLQPGNANPNRDAAEPNASPDSPTHDNNNNQGLAVAQPVADDDLEDARPVLPENEAARLAKRKQTNFMITIGSLCAIAVVVFLIIFFVVEGEKDKSPTIVVQAPAAEESNSTAFGNSTLESIHRTPPQILIELLPSETLPYLDSSGSAQARAFQWVTEDPQFDTYSEKRLQQRFALATFFYSTGGDGDGWGSKTNWLNASVHECHWDYFMPDNRHYQNQPGIRHYDYQYIDGPCVPSNESMVANNYSVATDVAFHDDYLYLALVGQELRGEIPPEITMLTSLLMIQLQDTAMEGHIPTILTNLTGLRELHLYRSAYTGTIPSQLALLTDLSLLTIGGNEGIQGSMPSEIGLLSDLETLMIVESNVTGTIPIEYTGLHPLNFMVYQNQLTGTIHTEFGLFSRVEWFMISENQLNSTIPTELGLMENVKTLYAYMLNLIGTIPSELGLLKSIKQIYIDINALTGTIPTELGLPNETFWRIAVGDNLLTGTIPSELGLLTECHNLQAARNFLTGAIPREVAAMPAMEYFSLQDNQFSGTLPSELFYNGSKMYRFWLENNEITGSIPEEIGYWSSLWRMRVDGNRMTGSLPSEIGSLAKSLVRLNVGSNQFSGKIPSEIGNLLKLKEFSAGDNGLTGTLPAELALLVTEGKLKVLNLTSNEGLLGAIPNDFCLLIADPALNNVLEFDCGALCGCHCSCDNVSSFALYGENGTFLADMKGGWV
ncbi:LRR receptor-like serine threonine-protein kinase [Seminavis robusta]|uniref:LRR receptor-like serine threonine-protein kinase n=1 Tax=Seminavis robusta TaxID=568900 RepID=A0A9N8HK12_9STRA|nr:LRR receptor-like serine threonine-protein kinase [Seminavis robusta]|eukprot:Sro904_g218420.1 LRR receptor-like serine threonine-protein kinase (893) ;mRNA; r:30154-33039